MINNKISPSTILNRLKTLVEGSNYESNMLRETFAEKSEDPIEENSFDESSTSQGGSSDGDYSFSREETFRLLTTLSDGNWTQNLSDRLVNRPRILRK